MGVKEYYADVTDIATDLMDEYPDATRWRIAEAVADATWLKDADRHEDVCDFSTNEPTGRTVSAAIQRALDTSDGIYLIDVDWNTWRKARAVAAQIAMEADVLDEVARLRDLAGWE
jgi:hypothetical protein